MTLWEVLTGGAPLDTDFGVAPSHGQHCPAPVPERDPGHQGEARGARAPSVGKDPAWHQIYCLLYLHHQVEISHLRKQGSQENLPTDLLHPKQHSALSL